MDYGDRRWPGVGNQELGVAFAWVLCPSCSCVTALSLGVRRAAATHLSSHSGLQRLNRGGWSSASLNGSASGTGRPSWFSQEVRVLGRADVFEHRDDYKSQAAAICSIAPKIGCSHEVHDR